MLPEDYLRDLFAGVGEVAVRRMFGGQGIYCDGLMIGLVADRVLYLKADADSRPRFEAAGGTPFVYDGKGKPVTMSYLTPPEGAVDDPEAFRSWAEEAIAAARRAAAAKSARSSRRPAKPRPPAPAPAGKRR